eukprot:gene11117-biopygen6243
MTGMGYATPVVVHDNSDVVRHRVLRRVPRGVLRPQCHGRFRSASARSCLIRDVVFFTHRRGLVARTGLPLWSKNTTQVVAVLCGGICGAWYCWCEAVLDRIL